MLTYIGKFIKNSIGALSIEFAGVFFAFLLIIAGTYDIYNLISSQQNLESTNYTIATLLRERTSNLYPLIDDKTRKTSSSLCKKIGDKKSCYKSYEFFDLNQVKEAQGLASKLLNKEVSIRIDGLFIFQDINAPGDLNEAKLMSYFYSSCEYQKCSNEVKKYLDNRSNMADTSIDDKNYTKLVPFVKRVINGKFIEKYGSNLTGRFIPLYRVAMCINKDESLFLGMANDRNDENNKFIPNLCSEVVVLSRCNDLLDSTANCPIYAYEK